MIEQHRYGFLKGLHHPVRIPGEVLIIIGVGYEFIQRFKVIAPVRSEYGIYRKALIAFIVAKYPIPEKFIGLFDVVVIELIVDDPDPGADAGQRPYVKCDVLGGQRL